MTSDNCHCPCEHSRFSLKVTPKLRFRCHCEICQQVYAHPYSDFVIVPAAGVEMPKTPINFKKMRPPPNLRRGLCPSCDKPVAGVFTLLPGLQFIFIPVANIDAQVKLPEPSGDLFYHRRKQELDDASPKYHGYWSSEWAISKAVLSKLLLSN